MFQTTIRSEQGNKKNDSNSSSKNKPKINFGEMLKGHASVPDLGKQPAQMMVEEEEEKPTQKKAIQKKTMVEDEEELQMKEAPEKKPKSSVTSGTKVSMPDGVKGKMENSFGTDFSNVNIHKDSGQATNMGALAYTQGNDVHFAPGQYNPNTREGQELLGHELAHVVQQRQGRVKPDAPQNKGGLSVNSDKGLENEADVMGKKAASSKFEKNITSNFKANVNSSNSIQKSKNTQFKTNGFTYLNGTLPYVSQGRHPAACGAAVLAMIHNYYHGTNYNVDDSISKILKGNAGPYSFDDIWNLVGKQMPFLNKPDKVVSHLNNGTPIVFMFPNHYTVAIGYNPDTNEYLLHNPDPSIGANWKYVPPDLTTGYLLLPATSINKFL